MPRRRAIDAIVTFHQQAKCAAAFWILAAQSFRPVETIEPLAVALGLDIKSKFDDDEVGELVSALGKKGSYGGNFGVISWRHSNIPCLITSLGAPADTVAGEWSEADYTTLVYISYDSGCRVSAKRLTMPF